MRGLVRRVMDLLGGDEGPEGEREVEEEGGREAEQEGDADSNGERTTTETRESAKLYQCSHCETTYISEEMNSCPECSQTVEAVPNESDLGMA